MKTYGGWAVILGALAILAAPAAHAQDEKKDPTDFVKPDESGGVTFNIGKDGVKFEDFVVGASRATGKTFVFDARRMANKPINMIGKKVVRREDVFSFLQVLFFAHEMAVVPIGPPETEVLLIEDIKTSQGLKQRATFVELSALERKRRNVGEIVCTTVPLKFIPVEKAQRALNNIITEHRAGFVQPIDESNSLLVCNFAPTVWTMYLLIQAMDVPLAENQLNFEKLALEYHVAEELAPIIESLIEVRAEIRSTGGGRPATARANQARRTSTTNAPPPPRIIPDPRTNSLLVYAIDEYMDEIKMLVANLDTEVTEPHSNIHIYELKNTNAEDIQDVLTELLQESRRGTRASGAGSRSQPRGTQRSAGALGSTDADAVNIVADPNTNSLLITATRARYEEIAEIVAKLDKRRPQVLVQAAIAELSDTDLQNIGVEIGQVEGGGSEARLFGATSFGLSTIDFADNVTGGSGDGTGGDGSGTGGGTGSGGTASGSNMFFDDLVRVPNLDAQGLVTGVFRNFIEVPILVQMFKQVVKGNLVSVPSILVNDNQEAHIIVGMEVPTTAVNQGQFSDQTSFQGYQEANLELSISPTISNDNYLRLNIFLSIQAFTGAQQSSSVPPPRTTREIETNITVRSGRTVVIGGLTTDNLRETVSGIPLLSEIPIIGELFKNTATNHDQTTLYVFITPTILSEFEALERISYERKLEIAKLEGQIHMVDPNFREIDLDDEETAIEELESTGNFDVPYYRASAPVEEVSTPGTEGVPVKPKLPSTPAGDEKDDTGGGKESSQRMPADGEPEPRRVGRRRAGAKPLPAKGGY